jgi:hypothetical protein
MTRKTLLLLLLPFVLISFVTCTKDNNAPVPNTDTVYYSDWHSVITPGNDTIFAVPQLTQAVFDRGSVEVYWQPTNAADSAAIALPNTFFTLGGEPTTVEYLIHPGKIEINCTYPGSLLGMSFRWVIRPGTIAIH